MNVARRVRVTSSSCPGCGGPISNRASNRRPGVAYLATYTGSTIRDFWGSQISGTSQSIGALAAAGQKTAPVVIWCARASSQSVGTLMAFANQNQSPGFLPGSRDDKLE